MRVETLINVDTGKVVLYFVVWMGEVLCCFGLVWRAYNYLISTCIWVQIFFAAYNFFI